MRKRVAYIEFPPETGNSPALLNSVKRIMGLNVRFNVKFYSQGGMPSEAHVEVYNLNRDDLAFLSTCSATWAQKQNLFRLYAGYEGEVKLLYSGQIMEATPQGAPDVVLRIHGLSDVKWWGHNFAVQSEDITYMQLIDRAAREMGYGVNVSQKVRQTNKRLNTSAKNFTYTGDPLSLISKVQSMMGGITGSPDTVFINIENEVINIWTPETVQKDSILLINKNTGLIGIPQPTGGGCTVKLLMNTGITPGQIVRVQSERIKVLNNDYYVIGVQHEGELRGNSWYTTLDCARTDKFKE